LAGWSVFAFASCVAVEAFGNATGLVALLQCGHVGIASIADRSSVGE
jgi:hypothetical protein